LSGPQVCTTAIQGLQFIENLPVFGDDRGSFRTWWRSDWPFADVAGLRVQQMNISTNAAAGTTRGSHIAPWNKYVHAFSNRAYAVILDARRDSATFGRVESFLLEQTNALFVPAGCGNAYQTIDDNVVYGYAVDQLWYRGDQETTVSLLDERFEGLDWPVSDRSRWIMSEKDRTSETLDVVYGS